MAHSVGEAVVAGKIAEAAWPALRGEVRRARDEAPPGGAEAPGDERRVWQRAGPDSEVDTFFDEVHETGRKHELDVNGGRPVFCWNSRAAAS